MLVRKTSMSINPMRDIKIHGEEANFILRIAADESRQMRHNWVCSEQLLLSLLLDEECGPARVLSQRYGVTAEQVRSVIFRLYGKGNGLSSIEIPRTKILNRIIERALNEAIDLGHKYVCAETMLLGMLQDETDAGAGLSILQTLEVDIGMLKHLVFRELEKRKDIEML